ncbi:heme-binding protein [uncultured Caulobacter sp.]|uniref:GlcG/HbpS family heme-binding protein n=1 Tax=uncultured Caulobacter sp. TaxID=158749 RepID=UPI0026184BFA|nr:heme-binding protein [uncultured Caulobacter sp.]
MLDRRVRWAMVALTVQLLCAGAVAAQQPAPSHDPAPAAAPAVEDYGAPIHYDEALKIIQAGMLKSRAAGLRQAFAIVEPSGELVAFGRMDGVSYGAIRAAQLKARTSARYRVATSVRESQLQGGRLAILSNDEVIAIGGGAPIVRDGLIVGAVGVSGGSADQDANVAAAIAAAENARPR